MVSFEKLLVSQVVQQEALTRLLPEKGIITREDFLGMVRVVRLRDETETIATLESGRVFGF